MADSDFNRKHPRDEDGKFTNKHGGSAAGSRERLENIYDSDKRGVLEKEKKKNTLTNSASHSKIPSFPEAKGFKNDKSRRAHEKHVAEMGFKSFEEYESAAVEFLTSDDGLNYMVHGSKGLVLYKFNKLTGELGVLDSSGYIITYFVAKKGNIELANRYFERDMKKKGGIKI